MSRVMDSVQVRSWQKRTSGSPAKMAAHDPTETLPIDYCALRGPDLYAILCEDRCALCLARAEEDDGIVLTTS